jgi:hypothetical protein
MRTTCIRYVIPVVAAIVHTGCEVRKDEDYVVISTEARSIQKQLTAHHEEFTRKSLEDAIRASSGDGVLRWEISGDPGFLIKSKEPHSLRAGGREKRFWYVDRKLTIVRP